MTGGQVFVHDPEERMERHLNSQLVSATRLDEQELDTLRELVARHVRFTGSVVARELLARWQEAGAEFWRVAPKDEVARIESAAEGTVAGKAA